MQISAGAARALSEGDTEDHSALFFDRPVQTAALRGRGWAGLSGVVGTDFSGIRPACRKMAAETVERANAPDDLPSLRIRASPLVSSLRPGQASFWAQQTVSWCFAFCVDTPQILCSHPGTFAPRFRRPVRLIAMSWVYKHQTAAFAVFAGAAFVMCLGALIHTAGWGYPVPKAAYLAGTIVYVILVFVYLFVWYHSRLLALTANPTQFLHRPRPWAPMPAVGPEQRPDLMPSPQPVEDTQTPPTTPPRESGRLARPMEDTQAPPTAPLRESGRPAWPPATAGYPSVPRPVEQVAAHPPAARFSPQAPPASRVPPPPPGPRKPPVAIARRPIGSAETRASAPPGGPARLNGLKKHAAPPAAEQPPPRPPPKMRRSNLSLSRPAEPTKPVPGQDKDAAPVQAGARGGTPVEQHGARPVVHGPH